MDRDQSQAPPSRPLIFSTAQVTIAVNQESYLNLRLDTKHQSIPPTTALQHRRRASSHRK
jgi:hypothetical protein